MAGPYAITELAWVHNASNKLLGIIRPTPASVVLGVMTSRINTNKHRGSVLTDTSQLDEMRSVLQTIYV